MKHFVVVHEPKKEGQTLGRLAEEAKFDNLPFVYLPLATLNVYVDFPKETPDPQPEFSEFMAGSPAKIAVVWAKRPAKDTMPGLLFKALHSENRVNKDSEVFLVIDGNLYDKGAKRSPFVSKFGEVIDLRVGKEQKDQKDSVEQGR